MSLTQGRKIVTWGGPDVPRDQQSDPWRHLEGCSLPLIPGSLVTGPADLLRQVERPNALASATQQNFLQGWQSFASPLSDGAGRYSYRALAM